MVRWVYYVCMPRSMQAIGARLEARIDLIVFSPSPLFHSIAATIRELISKCDPRQYKHASPSRDRVSAQRSTAPAILPLSSFPVHPAQLSRCTTTHNAPTTAAMDTDMTDAAYDIDIDVGAGVETVSQQPQQVIQVSFSAWAQAALTTRWRE